MFLTYKAENQEESLSNRVGVVAVSMWLSVIPFGYAQKRIVFPGVESFGRYSAGGRGGKVLDITNLNDAGEGSLRKAIQAKRPGIIVFAVSGTTSLERPQASIHFPGGYKCQLYLNSLLAK